MNVLRPYFSALPNETIFEIAKTVTQQHTKSVEQTIQHAPANSSHANKKERARAELNLGLRSIDRMFRKAALSVIEPRVFAEFVKDQVSKLAEETQRNHNLPQFQEGVRKLISAYSGVDFDFSRLNAAQLKACLTVLRENHDGHLRFVNLDYNKVQSEEREGTSLITKEEAESFLVPALKSLTANHPFAKINVQLNHCNLHGAKGDFGPLGAVTNLNLSFSIIDKNTFVSIFRGMRNSSIEAMNLNDTFLSQSMDMEAVHELALALQSTPHLKQLNLSNAFAAFSGNACAYALATTLGNTNIEHLDLSDNEISRGMNDESGCVPIFLNLPRNLATLDLSFWAIYGELHIFAAKLDQTRMTNLDLTCVGISGLELEKNIPGEQVSVASKLIQPSLQRISLELNINIGDSGAVAIARALPGSDLKELNLRSCGIGDEGFRELMLVLPLCNVTTLDLINNSLGSDEEESGAIALCDVLLDPRIKLTSISLESTGISEVMCHRIAMAAGVSNRAMKISFRDEHFTAEFDQILKRAYPLLDLEF